MTMIGLRFDLRVPEFATTTHTQQYRSCLEMVEWAERIGANSIILSEHHGVEDGFLSAPFTMAAAIAARTERIAINVAAALIPLHDPIRLAEQLATLALLAPGRISLVAGLGYRQEEIEMAGIERKQRGRLLEEGVRVMRQAWSGEPFEWRGRTVRVTPKPEVEPVVLIGGSTRFAARRAARLQAGFFPSSAAPEVVSMYEEECAKEGFQGGFVSLPGGPGFVHVSDDPERDWQRIGPHALFDAQTYASWQTADQGASQVHVSATTVDEVRASGVYRVVTPEECVAIAQQHGRVILHPLMGGIAPELAWEGLRRFESDVLPNLPNLPQ